jgi:hypothetical protein
MPLLLGLVVLLEPPVAPPEELLPLAPPVAPLELDLKYSSHSERDTWPSLFLSTVVKLGAELDAPPALLLSELLPPLDAPLEELGEELEALGVELDELPPLDAPDELLLPVALGEDEDLSLLEDELLCAIETLASANSAAAVAVVISFNFIGSFLLHESRGQRLRRKPMQRPCLRRAEPRVLRLRGFGDRGGARRLDDVGPARRLRGHAGLLRTRLPALLLAGLRGRLRARLLAGLAGLRGHALLPGFFHHRVLGGARHLLRLLHLLAADFPGGLGEPVARLAHQLVFLPRARQAGAQERPYREADRAEHQRLLAHDGVVATARALHAAARRFAPLAHALAGGLSGPGKPLPRGAHAFGKALFRR